MTSLEFVIPGTLCYHFASWQTKDPWNSFPTRSLLHTTPPYMTPHITTSPPYDTHMTLPIYPLPFYDSLPYVPPPIWLFPFDLPPLPAWPCPLQHKVHRTSWVWGVWYCYKRGVAAWWPLPGSGHQDAQLQCRSRGQGEVPAGGSHHGTVRTPKHHQAPWCNHWGGSGELWLCCVTVVMNQNSSEFTERAKGRSFYTYTNRYSKE